MEKLDAFATHSVLLLGLGVAAAFLAAVAQTIKSKGMGNLNGGVLVVGICLSSIAGLYLQHWVRDYLLTTNAQSLQVGKLARFLFGLCDVASIVSLLAASALGGTLTGFASIRQRQAGHVTRGTQVTSSKRWQTNTRKARARHGPFITIAGCSLVRDDEIKHFSVFGTTGTGKSVAIREMLMGAQTRGDRAFIADPDGGFLARFYNPARGDVILNPFDARSAAWDMMGEVPSDFAADQLAESLIPDPGGSADTS